MTSTYTGTVNVDLAKFQATDGNTLILEYLNRLEEKDEPVNVTTIDDFLKIPVNDGYKNNIKRVPNDFSCLRKNEEPSKTSSNDKVKDDESNQ